MDLAPLVPWLSAVALIVSLGMSITTFFTSGSKRNSEEIADHERRIQSIENDMRHLPDRDHAHRMELALEKLTGVTRTMESQLSGRMDALDERLKPVAAISARLQEVLIEQAKSK